MEIEPASVAAVSAQDLVDRAKRDLAKTQAHNAKLTEELLRGQQEEDRLRAFLATAAGYMNDVRVSAGPFIRKPPTQTETLLQATEEELFRAGRPLTIQELFTAMMQRGVRIGGTNPKQNYAGILSREGKGRVKYDRETGWYLDHQKNGPGVDTPNPLFSN